VKRRNIVVTLATLYEWPQIEALRRAWYKEANAPVQRRDNVMWVVALEEERVVGCYAYHDDEYGIRWVTDLYRVPGRAGRDALLAIYDFMCATTPGALYANVPPENGRQVLAMMSRGAEVRGLIIGWEKMEVPCHQR
jgi:hypothetical protein